MKEILTEKQYEILNIIKNFIDKNGYSPTVREIGDIANLNSPATVWVHLKHLKDKGHIYYEKGKMRTIRIIEG